VYPFKKLFEVVIDSDYIATDGIVTLGFDPEKNEVKTVLYSNTNGVRYCNYDASGKSLGCDWFYNRNLFSLGESTIHQITNDIMEINYNSVNKNYLNVTLYEDNSKENEEDLSRKFLEIE